MKKLVSAFAVCLLAGFVSAQSTVESLNVVGYSAAPLSGSDLFMFGSNFEKVGSTIGEAVTLSSLAPSSGFEDFDNIQVAVADGLGGVNFTQYFYLTYMDPAGWYADDVTTYAGDVQLPAGASVWMLLATTQDVTASGQVRSTDTAFTFEANKLTMTSSAYPIPYNPNTCVWTDAQDFDNIQVGVADGLGGVNFTQYFYLSYMDPAGWYADDVTTYAGDIAPIGAGFWVLTQGDVTMTQPSPL